MVMYRLTTEVEVVEDGPESAAAEEGDEEVLCDIPVLEIDVIQQVGNTCTPRALITALESLNSAKELEATGRFKDIDEKTEGDGSAWLEAHLDACDVYSRIVVVENLSMITSTSHHHLQLDALLDIFVPTETSFGLIVNTATAEQMDDVCRREGETAAELLAPEEVTSLDLP